MFRSFSKVLLAALLIVPAACLVGSQVALAQQTGTVAGTVVDAETGESLPGANVLIEETTLGAAADIDGNYRIIGVPVGTYDITASFVGYEPVTQTGVDISASFTRNVEFELSTGAELEEVEVVYERPLIERSAVGAPRVISGEDIQNLPVRGAENVASLQSGVVEGSTGGLNIRGGRSEEVAYYVDGVRVRGGNNNLALNNAAISEQEQLIGTIPARYGDVQSGVISLSTKTGRSQFFGSLEGVTSEVLDPFGYNLAALSIGGPIVSNRVGFFLAAEGNWRSDGSPYGVEFFQPTDATLDLVSRRPQALRYENDAGDEMFIPFPAEAFDAGYQSHAPDSISIEQVETILNEEGRIPDGFHLASNTLVPTPSTFTGASGFEEVRAKDDPSRTYSLTGNLNFNILPTLSLRLGGAFETSRTRGFSYSGSFYNANYTRNENDYFRLYGTLRQRISNNAFYQITADYQNRQFCSHPEDFAECDVTQLINYADVDAQRWATARRYFNFDTENGVYTRRNTTDGNISVGTVSPNLFGLAGNNDLTWNKGENVDLGVAANATVQLGAHQLEFGGEYRQQTNRRFDTSVTTLAAYLDDGNAELTAPGVPPGGVQSYEELPFSVIGETSATYYGYNHLGTKKVGGQNLEAFYNRDPNTGNPQNSNVAPWKPYYYAGYVSNRIEFSDLIVDVGFRVDAYNANTLVLKDLWANKPIFRVSDVRAGGFENVPSTVSDDWGVYYDSPTPENSNIVGYRDLDGNFYNTLGEQVTTQDIRDLSGRQIVKENANPASVFEDSETDFTFMPRLGVSFPVTDRALFFASYNVTAQRPTEQNFTPFYVYPLASSASRVANTRLSPEKTTQYELGFRQRLGERAALTLSGFYRTQSGKIALRNVDLGVTAFGTYFNRDFTTTQGAEIGFELRRTRHLAINANYTLSFARGSGSDANTTRIIAWRGNTFPNFISPADFDQRHTGNLTVDYRYGAGEGPVIAGARPFQNLGINVLATFGSGQRYTPLVNCGDFASTASFTCPTRGEINSGTLPATYQIDLKLDRNFDLGVGESSLKVYLWIIDLLNTKNVNAVYRETGLAGFQGLSPGSAGYQTLIANAEASEEAAFFNYNAFTTGPVNNAFAHTSAGFGSSLFYDEPRQIRLGVLFNF